MTDIERRAIDVIRGFAMDAPHAAKSGHQGTAMALAPLAHVLWSRIMTYDAADPEWPDRDRFVLSAGHASILLYSMLYLTGYGLELDDLRDFRQWGSAHAGPPRGAPHRGRRGHHRSARPGPRQRGRHGHGRALAAQPASAPRSCDHFTFVIAGDGCLSEGISHEAASLAGFQGLGRLVVVYDDNHITIDGPTELALTDDAVRRFEAYGWHVEYRRRDRRRSRRASRPRSRRAMAVEDRPSLVVSCARTSPTRRRPRPTIRTRTATRCSTTRSPRPSASWAYPTTRRSACPTTCSRGTAPSAPGRRRAAPRGRHVTRRSRPTCATYDARARRRVARRVAGRAAHVDARPTSRSRPASRAAQCLKALLDVGAGPRRRRRRPHRQHRHASSRSHGDRCGAEPGGRQIHFGVREHGMGGHHERHGAARRRAARRRHVPRVQRLHARRRAAGRDLAGPRASTRSRTTPSAWARTARRTSRSSTSPPCAPCPGCASSARPTPTRRPRRGRMAVDGTTARRR